MKFYAAMGCMILLGSLVVGAVAYDEGFISPPKMPADASELSTWDEDDIYILEKRSMKCNDVPNKVKGEPDEFKRWRKVCRTINFYWNKAYDEKKRRNGLETFKSLDLPE